MKENQQCFFFSGSAKMDERWKRKIKNDATGIGSRRDWTGPVTSQAARANQRPATRDATNDERVADEIPSISQWRVVTHPHTHTPTHRTNQGSPKSRSRLVPSFTEFYRVLPSFTEPYLFLLGFVKFYLVLPSSAEFFSFLASLAELNPFLPSFIKFYLVSPNFTKFD